MTKTIKLGKIKDIINLENGKVFLKDALELSSCEISLNCVPKGFKLPFCHKHIQNEEIYIILKGTGIFTVDDRQIPVKEGSCIKISPSSKRTFETTEDEDFQFICVQAKKNSLEQCGLADAELC